jgi:hypothetical protein
MALSHYVQACRASTLDQMQARVASLFVDLHICIDKTNNGKQ